MSRDQSADLQVKAEATGETPRGWAWAIYLDADQTLIARSRSLYWSRQEAQDAGGDAAASVRRNLQRRMPASSRYGAALTQDRNRLSQDPAP